MRLGGGKHSASCGGWAGGHGHQSSWTWQQEVWEGVVHPHTPDPQRWPSATRPHGCSHTLSHLCAGFLSRPCRSLSAVDLSPSLPTHLPQGSEVPYGKPCKKVQGGGGGREGVQIGVRTRQPWRKRSGVGEPWPGSGARPAVLVRFCVCLKSSKMGRPETGRRNALGCWRAPPVKVELSGRHVAQEGRFLAVSTSLHLSLTRFLSGN